MSASFNVSNGVRLFTVYIDELRLGIGCRHSVCALGPHHHLELDSDF